MGLLMRSPNAVMNAGFMCIFPLTFLSNVYVDPETLPSGLEAFVNANPVSFLVSACRGLMEGNRCRRRHRRRARHGRPADGDLRPAHRPPLRPRGLAPRVRGNRPEAGKPDNERV